MKEVIGRIEPPFMVKLALWPNMTRVTVWSFLWLSVLVAVASLIYGFQDQRFLWGGLLFFSALWYLMAIQWMDRNRAWSAR